MAIIRFHSYIFFFAANVENDNKKRLWDVIFKFLYFFFLNGCCLMISAPLLFVLSSFLDTEEKKFFACQLHLSRRCPHSARDPNGA